MYNTERYNRVKDIYSVPCSVTIGGEKRIDIVDGYNGAKWAYVQHLDGMSVYFKKDSLSLWECVRRTFCTNF